MAAQTVVLLVGSLPFADLQDLLLAILFLYPAHRVLGEVIDLL